MVDPTDPNDLPRRQVAEARRPPPPAAWEAIAGEDPAALPSSAAAAPPTASADGSEVCELPVGLLPEAVALRDWLVDGAMRIPQEGFLQGLAERLGALGVPVDRVSTAIDALHSEYTGIGRIWTAEAGYSFRLFPHGAESEAAYESSPFKVAHDTREWVDLLLAETPDTVFGIVPELKAEGYTHYLCVPLFFTNGSNNGITFATRAPDGFDRTARAILKFVMPTLSAAMEMRSLSTRLDNVLRIYVGDEPHREILSGAIRRGQVTRIRSAILFADMRSYTRISSGLEPEAAVTLLNTYFDCIVPPIEQEGGEILKYMGDGLLAIFRDHADDTGGTAQSALTAAIAALVKLDEANRDGRFPTLVSAGIALHHGEAAFGNVGSGGRLDFTVIGRDVNLASRIARLNKMLGEPLLMSKAFTDHLWGDPEPAGRHVVDGFAEPVEVFRLRGSPDDLSRSAA